jgi:hypothetical protein
MILETEKDECESQNMNVIYQRNLGKYIKRITTTQVSMFFKSLAMT